MVPKYNKKERKEDKVNFILASRYTWCLGVLISVERCHVTKIEQYTVSGTNCWER